MNASEVSQEIKSLIQEGESSLCANFIDKATELRSCAHWKAGSKINKCLFVIC